MVRGCVMGCGRMEGGQLSRSWIAINLLKQCEYNGTFLKGCSILYIGCSYPLKKYSQVLSKGAYPILSFTYRKIHKNKIFLSINGPGICPRIWYLIFWFNHWPCQQEKQKKPVGLSFREVTLQQLSSINDFWCNFIPDISVWHHVFAFVWRCIIEAGRGSLSRFKIATYHKSYLWCNVTSFICACNST